MKGAGPGVPHPPFLLPAPTWPLSPRPRGSTGGHSYIRGQPRSGTIETLRLARWQTRFFAWIIDFILLTAVLNLVLFLLPETGLIRRIWDLNHWGIFDLGVQSFLFFVYWTVLEGFGGQSVGKIALNLRVVDREGGKADLSAAALQAFGKAFLLPLDCLIGWLAMPGTRLRLFNRLSETIVISVDYPAPAGVEYVKDGER